MPLFSKKLLSRSKNQPQSLAQVEKSNRADRRRRLRTNLSIETLERRELFDLGGGELFVKALSEVDQKVVAAEVVVDSIGGAIGSIPLIGDKVAPYVKELHNAIDDVHKVVQQLANSVNSQALQNILRQNAYDLLGPSGAGILLNIGGTGPADSPDDAQITLDLANQSIDVHFHLGQSWKAASGNADLSIGAKSLPISFEAHGSVSVNLGFDIPDLHFGFSIANGFNLEPSIVNVSLSASVDKGSEIDATFGFLTGKITVNDPTNIALVLPVTLSPAGVTSTGVVGSADINLGASLGGGKNFPSVSADFVFHDTINAAAKETNDITAEFQHVRVNLGRFFSEMMMPVFDFVNETSKPALPIFKILDARQPILSDIPILNDLLNADKDNAKDVSIIDVIRTASDYGLIPEGYKELATLVGILDKIHSITTQLQKNENKDIELQLGSFKLGSSDSRGIGSLNAAAAVEDAAQKIVDDALIIAGTFKPDSIEKQLYDAFGAGLAGKINDALKSLKNGFHYSFPFLDNPQESIMQILVGRNADLFQCSIDIFLKAQPKVLAEFPIPIINVNAQLIGAVNPDIHIVHGYDTFGLRRLITDPTHNPLNLLDGMYTTQDSHIHLDGNIEASAFDQFLVFEAGVKGGVNYGAHLDMANPIKDLDGEKEKVRMFSELGPFLFKAQGGAEAYLDAFAKIGVDTPVGSLSVASVEFHSPHTTLLDFNFGFVPNPKFKIDPVIADVSNGILTLFANDPLMLKRNVGQGIIDDSYYVGLVGHDPTGDKVVVSAFGVSQIFSGVKTIIADGGTGADTFIIGENVNASATLNGDSGDDDLEYIGAGSATINGGLGDDTINFRGKKTGTLHGGAGKDQLNAGAGTNLLYGDEGDDVLTGGSGLNKIYGGPGNDKLTAGPQDDTLDGGNGNDVLQAGAGNATIFGQGGDDQFIWRTGNGVPVIDGGRGIDALTLFGSDNADVFTLSAEGINAGIDVNATHLSPIKIETINVQGGRSADDVTVNSLVGTTILDVTVNTADILNLDGSKDIVTVNSTALNDNMLVQSEEVKLFAIDPEHPYFGGVTLITGLPNYRVHVANVNDHLLVNSLGSNDTVEIRGVTGETVLDGGSGNETVTVKSSAAKDFLGAITVNSGSGSTSLNLIAGDTLNPSTAQIVDITSSQLVAHWSDAATNGTFNHIINFKSTDGGNFNGGVHLSTLGADDTVNVFGTPSGTTTSIDTGDGNDVVRFSSKRAGTVGNLQGIVGSISVNLGSGSLNELDLVDDEATSGNQSVQITSNAVLGLAGPQDNTPVAYKATGGSLKIAIEGSNSATLAESFALQNPNAEVSIKANAGPDKILVDSCAHAAQLDGGAGDDSIVVGHSNKRLDLITGNIIITAGTGLDQLTIDDSSSPFNNGLYAVGKNDVVRFGYGDTTFDGSLEKLSVLTSNLDDLIRVNAMSTVATTVDAGNGTDTLAGPNGISNAWEVFGNNAVRINAVVTATKVENLFGGSGDDTFQMQPAGALTGKVDGSLGGDTLDYSTRALSVDVDLNSGSVTSVNNGQVGGVVNIENATGGAGDDHLFGDSNANVLKGNNGNDILLGRAGNDQLFGDRGRDLMIGGAGADKLIGGDDDDLMIGNSTNYDNNFAALDSIMTAWTNSHQSYEQRVTTLRNGVGANSSVKLNSAVMVNDLAIDELTGNGGLDWFWSSTLPADTITDREFGERLN